MRSLLQYAHAFESLLSDLARTQEGGFETRPYRPLAEDTGRGEKD